MKLLHVIESLESRSGGTSVCVSGLIESLLKQIPNQSVFVNREKENLPEVANRLRNKGVPFLGGKTGSSQLKSLIKAHDVIHVHGLWLPICHKAAQLSRLNHKPYILSTHGMLSKWALNRKKIKKTLAWYLYQKNDIYKASQVHVTSRQESEDVKKFFPLKKYVIVPFGVHVPPQVCDNVRRKRQIIFVGRIHPVKGLSLLVKAVYLCAEKLRKDSWNVLVIGPDENGHKAELEKEILEHAIQDLVSFKGQLETSELAEYYQDSQLLILPSFSENFGSVIPEALAFGLPVITTTATPWHDIRDYNCGWWVNATVEAIANSLMDAVSKSGEELFEMGRRGTSLVIEKYSWTSVSNRMHDVYKSLTVQ